MLSFHLVAPHDVPAREDGAFVDAPPGPPVHEIDVRAFHAMRERGLAEDFDSVGLDYFADALLDAPAASRLRDAVRRARARDDPPAGFADDRDALLELLESACDSGRHVVVICD